MKKGKITRGLLLSVFFLSILFFRIPDVFASSNISDVCNSELKENFESFCNENGDASLSLDIFGKNEEKDDLKLQSMAASKSVSNVQNENEIIISENEEWSEDKVIENKIVAIMPGVELRIKEGVTVYLKNSLIGVAGKLIAEGTKEKPITFRKLESQSNQGFFIYSGLDSQGIEGDEIRMKYVDLSGGFGSSVYGAITIGNAKLDIKESKIHDNKIAVVVAGSVAEEKQVSRTKFFSNEFDVTSYFYPIPGKLLPNFQYNWWGSSGGPKRETQCYTEGCVDSYKKIQGYIDLKPWFVSEDFHDPVIIVPGIMGSATKYIGGIGEMELDPILGTYKNLVFSFEKNGYEKNKNLFEFPYEWRDSNISTAEKLKDKINEVKSKTGLPAVDIVAHSMGGLVSRYYIEGNNYQNDVNQLITLGTPHKGSPKSYMSWEAGEIGIEFGDNIIRFLFGMEAHLLGYDNLKDYIQSRIISVKELLPDYDYLREASSGEMRSYPNNYPQNIFLEFLNNQKGLNNLKKVHFFNIIGDIEFKNTIGKFRVTENAKEGLWEYGMPENFYDKDTDRGIEYDYGDGTVPLFSADGILANSKEEINSSHTNLPTIGQCHVINNLLGKSDCEYSDTFERIKDILTLGIFSPIDIQVVAPDGKRIGKNFETGEILNEMEGAFYSGFETENEFLTVPNPAEGEYKILAEGTGDGEYKIEINRISENEEAGNVEEASASISDSAQLGKIKEKKIQISQDEIKIIEENITVDSIIEKIKKYYEQGLIRKKSDRNFLVARLEFIKEVQKTLDRFKENVFINKKIKEKIIEHFEDLVNWNLDFLINYIKIKSEYGFRKDIDSEAGRSLIKDINSIKY